VLVRLSARVRSQAGAELVEFALVLPILLLVFGGIVDFGLLLHRQQVITNAAREGARVAVLPGYCTADVEDRVRRFVALSLPSATGALTTRVSNATLPAGSASVEVKSVQVTLDERFLILGPLVSLAGGSGSFGEIPLTATTTMRVEAVTAGCP